MKQTTRRSLLRFIAGAPLLAAGRGFAAAKVATIGNLIEQAKSFPQTSQRIDFISGSLRGVRYQDNTLIGGPNYPEQFVVRDDVFDCVTYCETVLAAAISRNVGEFETSLR